MKEFKYVVIDNEGTSGRRACETCKRFRVQDHNRERR